MLKMVSIGYFILCNYNILTLYQPTPKSMGQATLLTLRHTSVMIWGYPANITHHRLSNLISKCSWFPSLLTGINVIHFQYFYLIQFHDTFSVKTNVCLTKKWVTFQMFYHNTWVLVKKTHILILHVCVCDLHRTRK